MEYTNRPWYIADESSVRPGYCCLAIRETESTRLVSDLADVPDDVPGFVERAWEEARKIAFAPQLAEMLEYLLDAVENRGERFHDAIKEARELLGQVKGEK